MTGQELIDRDIRVLLGDLQLQVIFGRARIAELEEQLAIATAPKTEEQPPADKTKLNGKAAPAGAPPN